MIRIAREGTKEFETERARLLARGTSDFDAVEANVRETLAEVRRGGDAALLGFIERFESRKPAVLFTRDFDGAGALARLAPELADALRLSATRIARYHEHQVTQSFRYDEGGLELGMRVRPISKVGVYAPGGKARYPSSVLMSAVPARVAGVSEIILATPAPNDVLLAAAHLAGVTGILDAGGAQAIAALAYGTESVPKVDKIVGPGNRYVACAKRLVSARSASTGSQDRARSSSSATKRPTRAGSPLICSLKPSTTRSPTPCASRLLSIWPTRSRARSMLSLRCYLEKYRRGLGVEQRRHSRRHFRATPWPDSPTRSLPSTFLSTPSAPKSSSIELELPARHSSAPTPPRPQATTSPGPRTSCPPAVRCATARR